ncbi:hypothetical protein EKK58_07120 [Candidatus Dependentiae bacterium]|nr:MAG: hypothetical protein EKK58_07120 [Candidatus Dependentiae bacterium]
MEYPLNDILLNAINEQVQAFWQEYEEKCTENQDKKYCAFALLATKHQLHTSTIKQSSEENARNCAYIIWGYALLIIHYQVVHYI